MAEKYGSPGLGDATAKIEALIQASAEEVVRLAKAALASVGLTPEDAAEIFKLLILGTFQERFVIPETHRETMTTVDPRTMYEKRGTVGFGNKKQELVSRQW